jgi:hypothetical protein
MAVSSEEASRIQHDRFPLLKEVPEESQGHIVDIERINTGRTSSSVGSNPCDGNGNMSTHGENRQQSSVTPIIHPPPPSFSSSSSSSSVGSGRRHWSPFNTVLWISIELIFTLGQIIAAVVALSISRNENPQTPLFAWILGYAAGCTATLPLLYWRYINRNQGNSNAAEQRSSQPRQGSSQSETNSYITISLTRSSEEEDVQNTSARTWNSQPTAVQDSRLVVLVDNFKMALDCFFAVWFVVGNVWIFGGHSSSSDAPNLYRLCIVFLTFSCIGYAMPFMLCAMICCCLPCIISILGVRENMSQMRGASEECISALPTHKFKLNRSVSNTSVSSKDSSDSSNTGVDEGGYVAERAISGEDAVCCICLARYTDNDELRELPCSHFFHTECVDKWLKMNASCPLCKFEIGTTNENLAS